MCQDCFKREGSPSKTNDAVRAATDAIERVYEFSDVGGNLHIVLDDWSISDDHIRWCRNNQDGGTDEQKAAERLCVQAMLDLSRSERATALALFEGFIE